MSIRETLGDFSSIVCFKAVITGVEDTLGSDGAAVVFTRAGRVRGQALAKSLGLEGAKIPVEELAGTLNAALGKEGTRLCKVISVKDLGSAIEIETQETVCSAGEAPGSDRLCTFTLGAIWGALEAVTGEKFEAKHTASVLRGGASDTFIFTQTSLGNEALGVEPTERKSTGMEIKANIMAIYKVLSLISLLHINTTIWS